MLNPQKVLLPPSPTAVFWLIEAVLLINSVVPAGKMKLHLKFPW